MEPQGSGVPLPIAALSLSALAPTGVSFQRSARPTKAVAPSPAIGVRDGPRSHPIDAKLASFDVASSGTERAGHSHQAHRQADALKRLVFAIPGALNRLISGPASQTPFAGPARLSDVRVFPSTIPRRAARGGGALPAGGAGRKAAVMWFRNDLRLHDNPSLDRACREGTSVLPVYVFDPRDYGKAPNGFGRTGPARAQFILDAVSDLRSRLRAAGSELLVRVGRPEEVVPELAARVGAGAVYCQAEATEEEAQIEGRVRAALERDGCQLRAAWGGTLYHLDDLPFKLSTMPTSYAEFRARVAGLSVRPLVASEQGIKGLPQDTEGLEAGELPSLKQLIGASTLPQPAGKAAVAVGFGAPPLSAAVAAQAIRGGETEALRHLQAFMTELKASLAKQQPQRGAGRQATTPGPAAAAPGGSPSSSSSSSPSSSSSFSCKISPWLALGCLSPRRMYLEMKQQLGGQEPLRLPAAPPVQQQQQQRAAGSAAAAAGAGPANWLVFELLWRDFFRFVSQKYVSMPRPATTTAAAAAVAAPRVARSATVAPAYAEPAYALAAA
ncbi:hypothetical protein PLESTF_001428600 [Pleodorina starrii]|nr:hypothetical protein PLESTM_000552900 [Pleodorina starrii]GLC73858.1 hypothetical protein PLESTF_001428600 [Pleodorina starrii]